MKSRKLSETLKKLSKLHGRTDSESKPKQRKFKDEHVLWVKEYVDSKATKYFTAAHIWSAFNTNFGDDMKISVSTVTRILKNKLKMKYKKLEKTDLRTLNPTSKRFMAESLSLQLELLQENYELIWVDEFSLSSRASNMHEWCMVGMKKYVNFHVNAFWMNFIVVFSRRSFYGIMGVKGSTDSLIFGLFLKQLYDLFSASNREGSERRILVMENASIHKSNHIKWLVNNKKQEFWRFILMNLRWILFGFDFFCHDFDFLFNRYMDLPLVAIEYKWLACYLLGSVCSLSRLCIQRQYQSVGLFRLRWFLFDFPGVFN